MAPPGGERGGFGLYSQRLRTATPNAQKLCPSAQCFHLNVRKFFCDCCTYNLVAVRDKNRELVHIFICIFTLGEHFVRIYIANRSFKFKYCMLSHNIAL